MDKTVYILGAGFSIEGEAPPQEKILEEICNLRENDVQSLNDYNLNKYWKDFEESREKLNDFLQKLFSCDRDKVCNIELEDAFTILDKAIIKHQFIDKYSDIEITDYRRKLNFCIVYMFDAKLKNPNVHF